eukprot:m.143021 g.143021  ORF g.143021 m.143021 type:complete len:50 (+) comp14086_c0_seq2:3301-3450(+)
MTAMANKLFIKELTLFLEKVSVVWMITCRLWSQYTLICVSKLKLATTGT